MAQDVTTAVLTDKVAKVRAQTHVCDSGLVVTPFLDGEALEENESLAINEILAQGLQVVCQVGKTEVALFGLVSFWATLVFASCATHLGNAGQRGLGREEVVRCRAELLDLLRREDVCPFLRVLAIVLGLPDRRAGDLAREGVEGDDVVVEWRVLAGCLQAIGEDIHWGSASKAVGSGWESVCESGSHGECFWRTRGDRGTGKRRTCRQTLA